jgi:hypothetical protein
MFRSKTRPIVIPQFEHGRLAGALAAQWGNADFERPAIDFEAFVEGVALHDWHYGVIDNLPIGDAAEKDWLAMTEKGVNLVFEHPVTDIVAKLHVRRLLSGQAFAQRASLIEQIDDQLVKRIPESGFTREQFEWADKITRFCDFVAFFFCFEAQRESSLPVSFRIGKEDEVSLTYKIQPDGVVLIAPWPFAAKTFSGLITGYQADGYPEKLEPLIIPYSIVNGDGW